MKIWMTICVVCVLLIPASFAQNTGVSDSDIQLLRSDLQAARTQIITDTMEFTDAESKAFFPVFRDYTRDQQKIGDKRVKLIDDYAKAYDTMDDKTAKDLVQRSINIEDEFLNLREDYWKKFEKALGAKRAAKFYQVDNRLTMMVNLQLSQGIPLAK